MCTDTLNEMEGRARRPLCQERWLLPPFTRALKKNHIVKQERATGQQIPFNPKRSGNRAKASHRKHHLHSRSNTYTKMFPHLDENI